MVDDTLIINPNINNINLEISINPMINIINPNINIINLKITILNSKILNLMISILVL